MKIFVRSLIGIPFVLGCLLMVACSQPVLEPTECVQSRDTVKQFYSLYLEDRSRAIEEKSDSYYKQIGEKLGKLVSHGLEEREGGERYVPHEYYFLGGNERTTAFRAGKCRLVNDGKVSIEVLLFWRSDETNFQREISVDLVQESSNWVIDGVSGDSQSK